MGMEKEARAKGYVGDITQKGAAVLREVAREIAADEIGSPHLVKLIARMKKMMAGEKHGVALAAPQAGEALRLFVVKGRVFRPETVEEKASKKTETESVDAKKVAEPKVAYQDRVFINPVIVRHSRTQDIMEEGCLSVHGFYGSVNRYEKATVHALDEHGKKIVYHGAGLIAQIFQHEIDHLNGILYIDKAISLKKTREKKEAA